MGDRSRHAYASCYCEENVWHLAGDPLLPAEVRHVVFISNRDKTCAVWSQRSAPDAATPVIWDYHVVLLTGAGATARVWDLDATLDFPCSLEVYLASAFPRAGRVPERYAPRFRVVSAELFRATFASDRSHMRDAGGLYRSPPPAWPPIGNATEATNLARFIDVESAYLGDCLDLEALRARFAGR